MYLKLRIDGIEVNSFEMKPKPEDIDNTTQFHIDMHVSINPIFERKLAPAFIEIGVRKFGTPEKLAGLSVFMGFRIENFEEAFPLEDGVHKITEGIGSLLNSISLSTVRGILFSMLKGTYLSKAIIPIVDMRNLKPLLPPVDDSPPVGEE